jgi:hypothetical protein
MNEKRNHADSFNKEQIDDLAAMSREYEKQETTRMAHNNNTSTSSSSSENMAHQTSNEPYINEIIPVNPAGPRRRAEPDSRGR